MKLSETCAVITGGASGLGEATARYFVAQGAQVTILDRDLQKGTEIAAEIGATFVETDVTDEESVQAAIAKAQDEMGKVTACVNCAGIVLGIKTHGKKGPHPLPGFQKTIDINLVGSFNVARLAAAAMSATAPDGKGVIINTASIAAYDGQMGQVAYAASKGGIAAMTLPMARDLATQGVRVMAIAPGIFKTPMMEGLPSEVQDALAADVPCPRRLGDPSEFARLAAFIVEMDYLNAEVIRLDGGLRMS